jgi:serine/threonine-protein kinase
VESQRLRRKLREYYEIDGRGDPVAINFRPGSYVPDFVHFIHEETHEALAQCGFPNPLQLDPKTIAVLPLKSGGAEREQDYFFDGITEEIIYALSRISGLKVIGRTSVFALKDFAHDIRKIGTELGAGTVIEGSVRQSGNRVKLFVEMLDVTTREVRWAEMYECAMDEVPTVEAEIAQSIARVLQMTLAPPVSRRTIRGAPNMEGYLLYLQGRHAWNRMSAEGYRTAVEILERATSLYPSYASPYAGLADAYAYLALWGYARPREVFPKARAAALQALKLDSLLPHAYTALAACTAFYEWKWDEGIELARKAIELEPSYALGQQVYAWCLLSRGETEEARDCLERAVVLDPLSVRAHRMLGWMLYLLRRPISAEKWLQAALVLDREPQETHYLLASVFMSQRHFSTALKHAKRCQTDPPYARGLGMLGACFAHLNQREKAAEIIDELSQMSKFGYVDPTAVTHVQIALNNIDAAIDGIARSLDERLPFAWSLRLDPEFDRLRRDPRFGDLMSRLGM